jgi:23S rRNA (uracil1939-C5)-methyltransferase
MNDFHIEEVGRKGDGVAHHNADDIYIPFTLAGEKVRTSGTGPRRELVEVLEVSPDRIDAVCRHFGECGGCQLQHMGTDAYLNWKSALLNAALERADIAIKPEPMISFADHSRRKAVFSARHTSAGLLFGFQERADNRVVDIGECPVTVPEITERFEALRDLASSIPGAKMPLRISVLATRNGLDVDIEDARDLTGNERQTLVRKAVDLEFARLTVNTEILVESRKPELVMGSAIVTPPPGAFVQAIEEAEQQMVELVTGHLRTCKTVADLYCGVGTFALRLAERSKVLAVEASKPAIHSLDRAWRETAGRLKEIKTETRNLERSPLGFMELKHMDGLVFDPPRAGAELQTRQIAKSRVRKVAAVSCNPATLSRDLEILIEGGFKLKSITPVDQFRYTPHLEAVALLER